MAKSKKEKYEEAIKRNMDQFRVTVFHYKHMSLYQIKQSLGIKRKDSTYDEEIKKRLFLS